MENKMTRRGFIGSIAAIGALPLIGKGNGWFEDIRIDRYYVLQGGAYGDTGGWGQPGYSMGPELIGLMEYWEHHHKLEDKLDFMEREGFYLTPSSYFGEPRRRYGKMPLTKKWMMEFYRRHKDETFDMWKSGYDNYISDLKARGWRLVDGRFCNPEMEDCRFGGQI